ncbi:MAG TPA: epimerase [Gammaproteobacteria bacterium]|nr:epimerase [Gammaproteobacteria bacterium]
MKVILFGATGMVGQGVLRECLRDPAVERVLAVGRSGTGKNDPKLQELLVQDLYDYSGVESQLAGYDACFFCLGVSSASMKEADYRRITYDLTLAAAKVLARLNPGMTFIYVSGQGTDSSEHGRVMWARVKGATENALRQLPFKAAYMFRPGIIRPLHGVRSKTPLYQTFYTLLGPFLSLLARISPDSVTTSEQVGRAMLKVARTGAPVLFLENHDINRL